jgi:YD repeat-containing protein
MPQGGGAQNVTWTNAVGVTVNGNNLTSTGNGWNTAGAVSTQTIASGAGYMEFTASETTMYRLIGLSNGDTNQNYDDIDFAFYLQPNGTLSGYRGATYLGQLGSYATGDVLRIEVAQAGAVTYKKNGSVVYTTPSEVTATYPLLVDTSLYNYGCTLTNVVIFSGSSGGGGGGGGTQNASFTNVVGVSVSGNNLTKTAASGWGNAGAVSTQTIAGDGYMEFTASETNTYRLIGLSNGDSNQNYDDIDFAFYLQPNGILSGYRGATYLGQLGSYATGDVLRVAIEWGVVRYKKNGAVIYEATGSTPNYPLMVDTSLYTSGATITNVVISSGSAGSAGGNVAWTNQVGVNAATNNLTKTAADGWGNGGAVSTQTIPSGAGYMEFTASETNTYRLIGLSNGDSNQTYTDIDFAIYLQPNGILSGYRGATYLGTLGSYATGDVLRVEVDQLGAVTYKKNGTVFYSPPTGVTATYPLLVDTSLYTNGSTLTNVVLDNGIGAFSDQYAQNFISMALAREPYSDEVEYWEDIFRVAYAHQQGSMMIAVREMARTLFESAEYAARGRNNNQFVYDLYKTYLMREPDGPGWIFWEGQCNAYGREAVRRGFDESIEFATRVAAITPSGSPSSTVSSLLTARVDPANQPGNQLLARDAEWGVTLLSLPGRAGLDLGLGLSYSSAVWTRSGPYLYFDEDIGTPSPGFRLGFPVVQEVFFDAQVGVNVRPMILPSGQRVEFRQVGTSNIYETADSSYLQLIDYGNTLTVRSTDGTAMNYVKYFDWRCTQIEDRNGNLLTINNHWWGDIQNITDTLGRVITFNYDGNSNPISITQNGRPEPWVTFGWGATPPMQPPAGAVGTYQNEVIPVLTQVGLADGSRYNFEYTSLGQVNMIRRYTSDNAQRSYTAYNYASAANDSPRISATRVWADYWSDQNNVPHEVVTQFGIEGVKHTLSVEGDPNTTVYKETYGTGWKRGLPISSEVWSGGAIQKTTTTSWTQDNTTVNYQTNPRVTETNVSDSANNQRKTSIGYQTFTLPTSGVSCSLPNEVNEYEANGTTVARRTHTDYNLDSNNYLSRRIIGLPQAKLLYQGTSTLMAKTTYVYDWGGEYLQDVPATPTQHDASYNTGFVVGRGNVVEVRRWDVSDPTDESKAHKSKMGYDINGSVVFTRDSLTHQTTIGYTDAFSANGTTLDAPLSSQTFAYPTTVWDADGYSTRVRYRYDLGAASWKQTPQPNVTTDNTLGPTQKIEYYDDARLKRVTNLVNNAYTRYEYGPNYVQSFSSVNSVADDAYSVQVFDGAGRTFASAGYHPGSSGWFKAQMTQYDVMGRVKKQSNPTEMNGNWAPVGDDAAGWIYTEQSYDWKGRPLTTTNTDGTQKYASYGGCGCAGGEVVTLTDEVGRQQKIYSDVLGRTTKAESYNGTTIYSTTTNKNNALDQITRVRQYVGGAPFPEPETEGSGYQTTTMTYDGYARLQTKHVPEQNTGTATTYSYNNDDTINSVTDARGASATYSYVGNNRHLVAGITYSAPGGITIPAAVGFSYDAVGNRTSMTDGTGSTSYSYDQLSRMTSEMHNITGLGVNTISYQYNLANQLTSITNPLNITTSYTHDQTGRLSSVTGAGLAGAITFASNMQYRAWGAAKHVEYGDGKTLDATYNNRLQAATFQIPGLMSKTYDYHADNRLRFSSDLLDHRFDRSYNFDHAGRISVALSGAEARGEGATQDRPYWQTYGYDAMGHLTARTNYQWNSQQLSSSDSYTNNRHDPVGSLWQYDADGNLLGSPGNSYTYDAAGRVDTVWSGSSSVLGLDGDGLQVRSAETVYDPQTQTETTTTKYYVRSTVLGGEVLTEIEPAGVYSRSFIHVGGAVMATQERWFAQTEKISWEHRDPSNASFRMTVLGTSAIQSSELDPVGADSGLTDGSSQSIPDEGSLAPYGSFSSSSNLFSTYSWDGIRMPVDEFMQTINQLFHGRFGVAEALTRGTRVIGTRSITIRTRGEGNIPYLTLPIYGPDPEAMDLLFAEPQDPAQFKGSPLSTEEVNQLHKDVTNLLSDSTCAQFMKALLKQIGSDTGRAEFSDNAIDIFNEVKSQGGFGRRQGAHGAEAGKTVGSREAFININRDIGFATANYPGISAANGRQMLHELMHVASRTNSSYSHYEMARAAWEVATAQGFKGIGSKPSGGDPGGRDEPNSFIFDQILFQACNLNRSKPNRTKPNRRK